MSTKDAVRRIDGSRFVAVAEYLTIAVSDCAATPAAIATTKIGVKARRHHDWTWVFVAISTFEAKQGPLTDGFRDLRPGARCGRYSICGPLMRIRRFSNV